MGMKQNHPECEHCGYDERQQNCDHQLPVGAKIGKQYIIGKVLGQNRMGITYLAWDYLMKQKVIVKEFYLIDYMLRDTKERNTVSWINQLGRSIDSLNRERFCSEADTLAKLWGCPSFPKILRKFSENETEYLVTEFVEGTLLKKSMEQRIRPMSYWEAVSRMAPLMKDLNRAHNMGLVHLEIEPREILLTDTGSCLLGLGASRIVLNEKGEDDRAMTTAALVANPFDPLEHFQRRMPLGHWSDIYSISAVLYYCVTGKTPPDVINRLTGEADLNIQGYSDLDGRQAFVLKKGMALKPNERYASMAELYEELHHAL